MNIIEMLVKATGNASLIWWPDVIRAAIAFLVVGYAAYRDRDATTDRLWAPLAIGGLGLLLWDILHGNLAILALGAGLNVVVLGVLGAAAFKLHLISDPELKLLVALGMFLPLHPLLSVFPLQRSAFSLPFLKLFAVPLLINLVALIALYTVYKAVRQPPHRSPPPLAAGFGKLVPTSRVHAHTGRRLLYEQGDPTLFGLTGDGIEDYLQWRNETDGVADAATIAEVDAPQLGKYFDDRGMDDMDADTLADLTDRFEWLANQDEVWMTDSPSFERLLFAALVLALVIGNLPLFLLPF